MSKLIVIGLSIVYSIIIAFFCALPSLLIQRSAVAYFSTFFVLLGLELFVGKLWNYWVDNKTTIEMGKIDATNALINASQSIIIECAYCRTKNTVKIYVGSDNKYTCTGCKEINSVKLGLKSCRVTNPVMPKEQVSEIFKNLN